MKKVRLGVLDKHVEDTVRELSEVGVFHIVDITDRLEDDEFGLETAQDFRSFEECSDILRRINNTLDILDVSKEDSKKCSRRLVEEKPFFQVLSEVRNQFKSIEKRVLDTKEKLDEVTSKKEGLMKVRNQLKVLEALGVQVDYLGESPFLYTIAGSVEASDYKEMRRSLSEVTDGKFVLQAAKKKVEGRLPVSASVPVEYKDDLNRAIATIDFNNITLDNDYHGEPEEVLSQVEKEIRQLRASRKQLIDELDTLKITNAEDLLVMKELVEIEKTRVDVRNMAGKTTRVYILEGWVPEDEIQDLFRKMRRVTDERVFVRVENPTEEDKPPTHLNNPWFIKPFEVLTNTFGFPSYEEIDPTPLIALTFPILFGLMFGDVGHGLMVGLIGIALYAFGSHGLKDLGFVTTSCGIASMVFGYLYGDLFGLHMLPVVWLNPLHDPNSFLLVAITVGIIHIGVGLFADLIKLIRKGQFKNALLEPFPKIWLYYGAIGFGYLNVTQYGMEIGQWMNNGLLGILLIIVPLLLITFEGILKHLSDLKLKDLPAHLGEGGFEAFDTVLIFMSNTISYSRIFALILVHGGLFLALFSVTATFTGINAEHGIHLGQLMSVNGLIWFVIVFIGTVAIIGLEGLIVFLHTLRLHYYEWFTKFFDADGAQYRPFMIQRNFTLLRER